MTPPSLSRMVEACTKRFIEDRYQTCDLTSELSIRLGMQIRLHGRFGGSPCRGRIRFEKHGKAWNHSNANTEKAGNWRVCEAAPGNSANHYEADDSPNENISQQISGRVWVIGMYEKREQLQF
jgi:hypothetical protein